ncbi:choice-of-anchor L domain-containing protein [Labilithrix luteola]|nr:choice-of-anchor L domain-containing protein [Labilithrix luteola]
MLIGAGACTGATPTELEEPWRGTQVSATEPAGEVGSEVGDGEGTPAESGDGAGVGQGSGDKGKGGKNCQADATKFDAPGNGADDDCNGKIDDVVACDASLALDSTDPIDAAKALGLCAKATGSAWGVVAARWVKPDGTKLPTSGNVSHGILTGFGSNSPREAKSMLALSSGAARAPGQNGYGSPSGVSKNYASGAPSGYPRTSDACYDAPGTPMDGVALELDIRVPSNATSMSFAYQLFSYDFPYEICTAYADQFVVTMTPPPPGAISANIALDPDGKVLDSSSVSGMRACKSGWYAGLDYECPLGISGLAGTGYENHAASGWLRSTVPVQPGSSITLRFAIWDSEDGQSDSLVLLDGLSFGTSKLASVQVTTP